MASIVLGKRTRSAGGDGLSAGLPRAKRQAAIVIHADVDPTAEENPFFTSTPRSTRSTRSSARIVRPKIESSSSDIENDVAIKDISLDSPSAKGIAFTPRRLASAVKPAAVPVVQIKKHFSTTKSSDPGPQKENIKLEPVHAKITVAQIPSTPRRRDALSKQVPVTPRHRVAIGGFGTPRTPRTPSTTSQSTVYHVARQAFTRSSDPGMMVGREEERADLRGFIDGCIEEKRGGCTYVSGPPGTGKSATVSEILSQVEEGKEVKRAYVNCMSLKSSRDMSNLLLAALLGDDADILESEAHQTLQGMFCPRKKSATAPIYIITLDEIDHILTLDLEFLYQLFTWSMSATSHLILIGIANALDLTDRLLPRLKARNLKPHLLPFLPYTAAQIKAVLTTRLKSLMPAGSDATYIPFLHPAALELCSRKVAAQSGDLRKAFDIIRRSLDLVEQETKSKILSTITEAQSPSKVLSDNTNLATSTTIPVTSLQAELAKLTPATAPRASIAHLNKVTSQAFSNGLGSRLKTLNLQQKAALCSLLALERQKRDAATMQASFDRMPQTPSRKQSEAPSVKQLYDVYTRLCKQEAGLQPLTSTEFRDVVGSLETLSLVSGVDGRTGSFVMSGVTPGSGRRARNTFGAGAGTGDEKRVGACVGVREVEAALEGVGSGILRGILGGQVDL